MCVQLSLYGSQINKNAISGLWYPQRCRLDDAGDVLWQIKQMTGITVGLYWLDRTVGRIPESFNPLFLDVTRLGWRLSVPLNCSKNKYFSRGLNLNVQDSVFYASVFMEGAAQKWLFSWNLHALNPNENCFHPNYSSPLEVLLVRMQLWELILANSVLGAAEWEETLCSCLNHFLFLLSFCWAGPGLAASHQGQFLPRVLGLKSGCLRCLLCFVLTLQKELWIFLCITCVKASPQPCLGVSRLLSHPVCVRHSLSHLPLLATDKPEGSAFWNFLFPGEFSPSALPSLAEPFGKVLGCSLTLWPAMSHSSSFPRVIARCGFFSNCSWHPKIFGAVKTSPLCAAAHSLSDWMNLTGV